MKRLIPLLLVVALLFSGCGNQDNEEAAYSGQIGGTDVVVIYSDPDSGRIVSGSDTYEFEFSSYSYDISLTLTYPDGESAMLMKTHGGNGSKWTDGADLGKMEAAGYLSIYDVFDTLENLEPEFEQGRKLVDLNWPLIGLALLIGVFSIISVSNPEGIWHFDIGWRFRNAEPSNLSLSLYRVFGYIGIFAAAIMLLIGIFA